MAPGILNYLGVSSGPPKKTGVDPIRALPASWYTSEAMYELERRAIFSRKWLLVTHKLRLSTAGDYIKFDVAGYQIVLCQDRHGNINGFHNVCRHRAYPVVQSDSGSAKIFSCKYHGWSYGLDGKLAKAPKYDELSNFDKSSNGLLPIHVKVDAVGFIWINLDASKTPEAWESDFAGIDIQERYKQYKFDDYVLDHEYQMTGAYNWKILVDNFNECYHCPTTHPDIGTLADIETLKSDCDFGWIQHSSVLTGTQKDNGLGISSTYLFPNASIGIFPHYMMIQRFLPTSANSSSMHYQIFRNKTSSEEDFQLINQMYKRILAEDKDLCEFAQANLQRGVFTNGELHPRVEKGPLFFQQWVREAIRRHHEDEKKAKAEIWPAKPSLPSEAIVSKEDEDLCSGLACGTRQEGLVW